MLYISYCYLIKESHQYYCHTCIKSMLHTVHYFFLLLHTGRWHYTPLHFHTRVEANYNSTSISPYLQKSNFNLILFSKSIYEGINEWPFTYLFTLLLWLENVILLIFVLHLWVYTFLNSSLLNLLYTYIYT